MHRFDNSVQRCINLKEEGAGAAFIIIWGRNVSTIINKGILGMHYGSTV